MDERILIGVLVCVVLLVVVVVGVIWKRKEKFTRPHYNAYLLTTNRLSDNSMQAGLTIKNTRDLQRAVLGRTRY